MALHTASGQAPCPQCLANISLTDVMQNEITQCPDCGVDLEITSLAPIMLTLASRKEND